MSKILISGDLLRISNYLLTFRHDRQSRTLKEYVNYVKCTDPYFENEVTIEDREKLNVKYNTKQYVYYGVNVDLDDYTILNNELENKLPNILTPGSHYDALHYVRQHVKGMTIPQIYIKVPHVWTGGHEENLRFRSININHGPGDSYWWGVPQKYSKEFAELAQKLFNSNIYKREGTWFPHWEFFMLYKIPVIYGVQKSKDTILVGAGCIHW